MMPTTLDALLRGGEWTGAEHGRYPTRMRGVRLEE